VWCCSPAHSLPRVSLLVSLSAAGVLRAACASLLSSDPTAYHLLLCSSTGALVIGAGFAQCGVTVSAKQLWQRIESSCTRDGPTSKPKGGGSEKIAQG
jgi:hypothetical protein